MLHSKFYNTLKQLDKIIIIINNNYSNNISSNWSVNSVPGIVIHALHVSSHLTLTITLWGSFTITIPILHLRRFQKQQKTILSK